jgi:hydrocephalus-inducing protein
MPAVLREVFILESKIGKERLMKPIIESELLCTTVIPLLDISAREGLDFEYVWAKSDDRPFTLLQRKDVTFTNKSAVILTFILKTEIPFNLSRYEYTLQPGESAEVTVEFDPLYQDTRASHSVSKPLQIVFKNHPQKDSIKLNAMMAFPNLGFESTDISFGSILNGSSKRVLIKVWNTFYFKLISHKIQLIIVMIHSTTLDTSIL